MTTHSDYEISRIQNLGMSPRQRFLQALLSAYNGSVYDVCKVDWDGTWRPTQMDREVIAERGTALGYFAHPDEAAKKYPLKYRRPSAVYSLVKVIVDRFTSMLFSQARHPRTRVIGDSDTEDYLSAMIEQGHLWQRLMMAREFGGACGTAVLAFGFVDGMVQVEVLDPRWLTPTFDERRSGHKLVRLEKRMQFCEQEWDATKKRWVDVWYWYRRVLDEDNDTVFKVTPVQKGEEPRWVVDEERSAKHGFGFVPAVWIQNLPAVDQADGIHDWLGIEDLVRSIDQILSQAHQGVLQNCDPTMVIKTLLPFSEVAKGSFNAIKVGPGDDAHYMEANMAGIVEARNVVELDRRLALEVVQCVLEHPNATGDRTATEIERALEPMLAKADVLREQYGQAIIALAQMMIEAARKVTSTRARAADGTMVITEVKLPPRVVVTVDDETGEETSTLKDRALGPGGVVELQWPGYYQKGPADKKAAIDSALAASTGELVDMHTGVASVAPFFDVDDVRAMEARIRDEREHRLRAENGMPSSDSPVTDGEDAEDQGDTKDGTGDGGQAADGQPGAAQPNLMVKTDTVLNGAQISAALEVVKLVGTGEIERESALGILEVMFNLTPEMALKVLGPAKVKEDLKKQPAPAFGQPPPGQLPATPAAPDAKPEPGKAPPFTKKGKKPEEG